MKPDPNPNPSSSPWYFLSLASGCLLAWFWIAGNKLEVFLSGAWVWPYLVPATLTAICLPLLGALFDLRREIGLVAVLSALAAGFLLVLGGRDGLQEQGLAPLWAAVFILHLSFHQAALSRFTIQQRTYKPAYGLALALCVVLATWFGQEVLQLEWPWRALLLLAALVLMALFAVAVLNLEDGGSQPPWSELKRRLAFFPSLIRAPKEVGYLFLFMILFAAASTQLQSRVWEDLALNRFPVPAASYPFFFLGFLAIGAAATATIVQTYGLRRSQMVLSLTAAVLAMGLFLSRSGTELTLIIALAGFILGLVWGHSFSLLAVLTPVELAGQASALGMASVVLGVAMGHVLGLFYQAGGSALGASLLFLLATLAAQKTRAGQLLAQLEEAHSQENPRNFEWDWADRPTTGLSKHTLWSKATRLLARTLAEIFFGRLRILGREKLRHLNSHGTIFVANHPNTFFDPLLITALAPGRLHYWAKSTLWKLPLAGSILDNLGAIPVYRRQDGPDPEQRSNDLTMTVAAEKLNQDATMLIFPEGVSEPGLSLKPVKTGAARLGFTAMEERAWKQDLCIVAIAIDYSEPSIFRSAVTLRIADPVHLAEFAPLWHENPREAVKSATDLVRARLADLLPHLEAPEQETLVQQVQELYGERLLQILGENDVTTARKAIADAVNHYHNLDPDTLVLFRQRVEAYRDAKSRLSTPENHPPIPMGELFRVLRDLFSLASFGLVLNWIPYRLTGKLVEMSVSAPVWIATAKVFFGGMVFGLYYACLATALTLIIGPFPAAILLFLIVFSAFVALGAMDRFAFRFRQLKTLWQAFWTQDTDHDLEEMKVSLLQDLERFREAYAFFKEQEAP